MNELSLKSNFIFFRDYDILSFLKIYIFACYFCRDLEIIYCFLLIEMTHISLKVKMYFYILNSNKVIRIKSNIKSIVKKNIVAIFFVILKSSELSAY